MPEINLPTKTTQDQIQQKVDDTNIKVTAMNNTLSTIGKKMRSRVYTANGTFVVPTGVTEVYLTGGGGGGGGGRFSASAPGVVSSGGITSFGTYKSITGGGFGRNAGAGGYGGEPGGTGGQKGQGGLRKEFLNKSGDGGNSGPYYGGRGGMNDDLGSAGGYCSGGGGQYGTSESVSAGGGGGADFIWDFPVTVTPGQSVNVVIGEGGDGGNKGGKGILTIKWWE